MIDVSGAVRFGKDRWRRNSVLGGGGDGQLVMMAFVLGDFVRIMVVVVALVVVVVIVIYYSSCFSGIEFRGQET